MNVCFIRWLDFTEIIVAEMNSLTLDRCKWNKYTSFELLIFKRDDQEQKKNY